MPIECHTSTAGQPQSHQAPEPVLGISEHFRTVMQSDHSSVVFHSLFGNLCLLDREATDAVDRLRGLRGTFDQLCQAVGPEVVSPLHAAYLLAQENEERQITEGWLTERASNVSNGRYLGGLQITSSNACNFSCSYCFADASDRRSPKRQAGANLPNISFETACKAIDQVAATARLHGRPRIGVKFLGREPLVNFRVMDQLFSAYPSSQIAWSVTTNGSLITREIAARLAEVGAQVVISIDGLPEVNDAVRHVKAGRGARSAYELAQRGLQTLISAGVSASVSSVISASTEFETMPGFFRRSKRVWLSGG